jgi:hypothetical protein
MAMKRELDRRLTGGVEVVLYWHGADSVSVSVLDTGTGEEFELEVEPALALDAFRHPYAYAAGRGVMHAQPAAVPRGPAQS